MSDRNLYLGPITDNRRWDRVAIRPDDVIVVTPPKSGTTWMQTIIALLLSGDPDVETDLTVKMPWVDFRLRDIADLTDNIDAMSHRRSLKSHTPLDGVPLDRDAQYICVFRHPLDVHFSYRQHLRNFPIRWFDHWYPEDDPDGIGIRRFLEGGATGFDADAVTLAHILQHYKAAQALAARANVHLFHYADMSRDLPGACAQVAAILGVTYPAAVMDQLISVARFDHMKSQAVRYAPSGGKGVMKSDTDFFHSGSSGKWHGKMSQAELQTYNATMDAHLSKDARAWLEYGTAAG